MFGRRRNQAGAASYTREELVQNLNKRGNFSMTSDGANVKEIVHSFLMIGQSNMAGRGNFGEVEPIRNPDCYMLRMGRWQTMSEPINPDRGIFEGSPRSGVGLAASFADEYAKATGNKIGLIPCADGGTSISQWMPGSVLYDHAVMLTRLAMRSSVFKGFLWHQGESDCNEKNISRYKDSLVTFIRSIRRDLGCETAPFIMGEVSEEISSEFVFGGYLIGDYPKQINRIIREVCLELPHCYWASSKGLTLKKDGLHFDSASAREFGKRYFAVYLKAVQGT